MAGPDARTDGRRPAPLGRRRGRSGRDLRRHRPQPTGDPRLLGAAAVSISVDAAAHPRRRHRGVAAGRSSHDDRGSAADAGHGRREAGRARRSATTRSSRRTTRCWRGAASRRTGPTRRRASSTSERRGSGSARTCAPSAAATSRAPATACFSDLLTDEGTFRPVDEMLSIIRSSGVDPAEVRATYCQGGGACGAGLVRAPRAGRLRGRPQLRGLVGGMGQPPGQPDRGALTGRATPASLGLAGPP